MRRKPPLPFRLICAALPIVMLVTSLPTSVFAAPARPASSPQLSLPALRAAQTTLEASGFQIDSNSPIMEDAGGTPAWLYGVRSIGGQFRPDLGLSPLGVMVFQEAGDLTGVVVMRVENSPRRKALQLEVTVPSNPDQSVLYDIVTASASGASDEMTISTFDRASGAVSVVASVPLANAADQLHLGDRLPVVLGFKECATNCIKTFIVGITTYFLKVFAGCVIAAAITVIASSGLTAAVFVGILKGCLYLAAGKTLTKIKQQLIPLATCILGCI